MIIYAERWDEKLDHWRPVRLDVEDDDVKETGRKLQLTVMLNEEHSGEHLRLTSDQAAKLLAAIGEVLE